MPALPAPVRIGTRASALAQAQTRQVQAALAAVLGRPDAPDEAAPLVLITTTGDRIQDRRLLEVGGKALFTKELDAAMAAGEIDCAVHSLKDVPSEVAPGLVLFHPRREDPRDALLTRDGLELDALPEGARVGTASLRRGAQLRFRRPDLRIELLRGNVDSRLRRLDAGDFDAVVLAAAGLERLGLGARAPVRLDPVAFPPAPGQGALALQAVRGGEAARSVGELDDAETRLPLAAERGALEALEGSCRTAMGAHAVCGADGAMRLVVEALVPDGSARFRRDETRRLEGDAAAVLAKARAFGLELGRAVRDEGGDRLDLG